MQTEAEDQHAALRSELAEARALAARYLELSSTMMVALDLDARVTMANDRTTEVLGYSRAELIGANWLELVYPGPDLPAIKAVFRAFVAGDVESAATLETVAISKSGEPRTLMTRNTALRDDSGAIVGTLSSAQDITERRRAEALLVAERDRARRYLDMSGTMMLALDRDRRVTLVNKQMLSVLGYTEAEMLGRDWLELAIPEDERDAVRDTLTELIDGGAGAAEQRENSVVTKSGERRTVYWQNGVDRDETGRIVATLSAGEDVTERRRSEREIAHLAYHDRLTGLANRARFEEHLQRALAAARRSGESVALLFMDLDRFKLVNDSLGHAAGDRLLGMVADRLAGVTRDSDLVARQGGDEFLLMVTGLHRDARADVDAVVKKLRRAMEPPFTIAGAEFHIGISIGVSVFPSDADRVDRMLKNADGAMYQAKAAGPGGVAYFAPGAKDARDRLAMTTRLRSAVAERQFVLHYQPIFRLDDGAIEGVEALLRWDDPDDGLLLPGRFLGLAEDTGLMGPIGVWVIEEACRQARAWRDAGLSPVVAFNLSPRQVRDAEVESVLGRAIAANGLQPEELVVELTESAAMAETGALDMLRGLGVRLAIDDFGTGYSSLGRLRGLAVDQLKIDRQFLHDVPADAAAATIVHTIVGLARGLGVCAVGEGVETAEQHAFLQAAGCPLGQGFHLARPMPADEVTRLMRSESATG